MADLPLRAAARPVAEWWGEQVRSVTAETDGVHPELSTEQAYTATAQIAMRSQAIEGAPVGEDVVDAFVGELARLLAEDGRSRVALSVDYGPCIVLARAAEVAGLPLARFPLKTSMRVCPDHVVASAGYRAQWRLVWAAPGWDHPLCGAQEWPEGSADPVGPECQRPRWHEGGHDYREEW